MKTLRDPLVVFLAGSVGLGWALTLLSAQFKADPVLLPLIALPVSYVPALMAMIALRLGGDDAERRAFRRRLTTVRVGVRWYAVALIGLPLIHIAGVAAATFLGGAFPFHPALLALLPLFLFTNLGEEIGWRGYALPRLQQRLSPLTAGLVLGAVWAAFHWVALAGNQDAPLAYVTVGSALLVAMSVIMTFVFNLARQAVPLMALLHASYDTISIGVMPLVETRVPLAAFALTALVAWLVVIGLIVVKGAELQGTDSRSAQPHLPSQGD